MSPRAWYGHDVATGSLDDLGHEEEEGPTDLKGRLIDAVVGGPPESPTDWALHIFSIIPKVAPFRVRVNLGLGLG